MELDTKALINKVPIVQDVQQEGWGTCRKYTGESVKILESPLLRWNMVSNAHASLCQHIVDSRGLDLLGRK